jgi:hypothetical protein
MFAAAWQGCGSEPREVSDEADTGPVGNACPCPADQRCAEGVCVARVCVDEDGDSFGRDCPAGDDCDDTNPRISPAATEVCDDIDNNCDFFIDEGDACGGTDECDPDCSAGETSCAGAEVLVCGDGDCPQWERTACPEGQFCRFGECVLSCEDRDQDGSPVRCAGVREDCDDNNSTVYPGAPELCDELDNNCDTRVDENFVCDADCVSNCEVAGRYCSPTGAGYTECRAAEGECLRTGGFVPCDAGEVCVDGACSADPAACVDPDGDGAGPGCGSDDCRNTDPDVYAGAAEVCDGIDNDCDGAVDEGVDCSDCIESSARNPRPLGPDGAYYGVACTDMEYINVPAVGGAGTILVVGGGPGLRSFELRYSSLSSVRTSIDVGGMKAVRLPVPAGGNANIFLTTVAGQPYFIAARNVTAANACEDTFEPNFSDTVSTLAAQGPLTGAAGICGTDFDHFSVEARSGQIVVATVVNADDNASPLVSIRRDSELVGPSGLSDLDANPDLFARFAHFRASTADEFVVQASRLVPGDRTDRGYVIALSTISGGACTDDRFETGDGGENDSIRFARTVTPSSIAGVLCAGDYDIYDLGASDGGAVQGRFTSTVDGMQVQVLEGGWNAVRSFPIDRTTRGERLYVAVFGSDHTVTGNYTLNLEF